jgi:hypothetical protein
MLPPAGLANMNGLMGRLGYSALDDEWNRSPSYLRRGLLSDSEEGAVRSRIGKLLSEAVATTDQLFGEVGVLRIVVEEFRDDADGWWISYAERSATNHSPSLPASMTVVGRAAAFLGVLTGILPLADALDAGDIRLGHVTEGDPGARDLRAFTSLVRAGVEAAAREGEARMADTLALTTLQVARLANVDSLEE